MNYYHVNYLLTILMIVIVSPIITLKIHFLIIKVRGYARLKDFKVLDWVLNIFISVLVTTILIKTLIY